MFGLSRSTGYAVTALVRLAEAPEAAVSARALAVADGSPGPLLSGVLKRLHQAGLVASKRGARGGYYLQRPPERIALSEVIAAIEGPEPVRLTPCCEQDEPARNHPDPNQTEDGCRIMCHCPITGAIRGLNRRMHRFLDQLTLADLLEA